MQQKHVWKHIQVNFERKTCCYLMVDNGKCMLSPSLISYLLDLFLSKLLLFFCICHQVIVRWKKLHSTAPCLGISQVYSVYMAAIMAVYYLLYPKRWDHVSIREFLIFSGCVSSWINIR